MGYKYDFEEKHEERMVNYVKSSSSNIAQKEYDNFIRYAPNQLEVLKEYYENKRKEILILLNSDSHIDYQKIEKNYYCDKNCILSFAFFLRKKALDSKFDNISDFFYYWHLELSKELSYFQFLQLIDNWYKQEISKTGIIQKEENLIISEFEKYNYNSLKPDFEIQELANLFCGSIKYAYLMLNLLYEGNRIDENCKWIASTHTYGSMLGIIHAYRSKEILLPKTDVIKYILPPVRKFLKAGQGKLNSKSESYRVFYNKTIDVINGKSSIKLNVIS